MTTDTTPAAIEALLTCITGGRAVQFHPDYCPEAKDAPVGTWDTSHDLSVIREDGSRYKIGHFRHAADAMFDQWCRNNVPALAAERDAARQERDEARALKETILAENMALNEANEGLGSAAYLATARAEKAMANLEVMATLKRNYAEMKDAAETEAAALRDEVARLRYVIGGCKSAIDTGRNEPLRIWREQIDIALMASGAALSKGGEG